ncbi:HoxN/HupN/NixA family nickel/cobalt transporter [Mycobacterium antarcticum]|uniref:HoxN/HupN/NixA family nickel/cobalt transporter n=1 Tax=Mycolicibacterium sp. TUM20984 TaxID=3023368 RepID=UPI0023A3BEDD|nr:hypothetical protein [Mycolicibacterium sp. TUM20984]GLP81020.1 hypothetical protein TUM20984_24400 [Mycolicibacterium sp. TUM20984]
MYVTPSTDQATIDLELTPGVLIGPAFTSLIDTDGDRRISDREANAHTEQVLRSIHVAVDGTYPAVTVRNTLYPDATIMAAGGATITIELTTRYDAGDRHTLTVTNDYQPVRTGAQASVTPFASVPITDVDITHADAGRTMTVAFTTGRGAPGPPPSRDDTAAQQSAPHLLAALGQPLRSPWALTTLLVISAVLGALHALTPGHGKTLMAAYLVGEQRTPRQAFALAGGITVTHTASVVVIGVAVLAAGQRVVPAALVPTLELVAGVAVTGLGVRLALRRWSERGSQHGHVHRHLHLHLHPHPHPNAGADADVASHARDDSLRERRSPLAMLTMSLSGGVVPCPEALGVLMLAVGVHRTALGVAMVVAFSAGLAAVLVVIGLLLVLHRPGRWLRTHDDHGWKPWIPMVSALAVTGLGAVFVVRSLHALILN